MTLLFRGFGDGYAAAWWAHESEFVSAILVLLLIGSGGRCCAFIICPQVEGIQDLP